MAQSEIIRLHVSYFKGAAEAARAVYRDGASSELLTPFMPAGLSKAFRDEYVRDGAFVAGDGTARLYRDEWGKVFLAFDGPHLGTLDAVKAWSREDVRAYVAEFSEVLEVVNRVAARIGEPVVISGFGTGGDAVNEIARIVKQWDYLAKDAVFIGIGASYVDDPATRKLLNFGFADDAAYRAGSAYQDARSSIDNVYFLGQHGIVPHAQDQNISLHSVDLAVNKILWLIDHGMFNTHESAKFDNIVLFDDGGYDFSNRDLLDGPKLGSIYITGSETGADSIQTSRGSDKINGVGGNDTIISGNGNDSIYGGSGADVLRAGAGGDRLSADIEDQVIDGGSGYDIAYASYASEGLWDTEFQNIELVEFSYGDDSINMSESIDIFESGTEVRLNAGDDYFESRVDRDIQLQMKWGNDTYFGQYSSNDDVNTGRGDDLVILSGNSLSHILMDFGRDTVAVDVEVEGNVSRFPTIEGYSSDYIIDVGGHIPTFIQDAAINAVITLGDGSQGIVPLENEYYYLTESHMLCKITYNEVTGQNQIDDIFAHFEGYFLPTPSNFV